MIFVDILKRHYVVIIIAFFVGIIAVFPTIYFRVSLGTAWRGIDLFYMDNDEFYMARMQEIQDGHPLVSSISYYEYKNNLPALPPTAETVYVVLGRILGISLPDVMVLAKFLFPALLFLLVYNLARNMTEEPDSSLTILYGVTAGLLVVLGYDLTDYHRLLNIFRGGSGVGGMVIWTRPINPIFGALALFSFLNALWYIIVKKSKSAIIPAGVALAFMFSSYFFSWGAGMTVFFWLGIYTLYKKDYSIVKNLAKVLGIGLLVSSPYWYLVIRAHSSPNFSDSADRYGLIFSHNLLVNYVLLAGVIVSAVAILIYIRNTDKNDRQYGWIYFSCAMLLGGLLSLNQQIITGMTIWPFHFVQYTTPFFYIVMVVILYHVVRPKAKLVAHGIAIIICIISVAFAIYTGAIGYKEHEAEFRDKQKFADIYTWLNQHTPKDSVVFVKDDVHLLQRLIPAYTHNNVYVSEPENAMAAYERFYHNYLVYVRMKGVPSDGIKEYLAANQQEATGFLHVSLLVAARSNNVFPEVRDYTLEKSLASFPKDYEMFLTKDLLKEFKKYRLDYILSYHPLDSKLLTELHNPFLVFEQHDFYIYDVTR